MIILEHMFVIQMSWTRFCSYRYQLHISW